MQWIKKIYRFATATGKKHRLGKSLGLILFIKLFIMFVLLKLLFFPDFLKTRFKTDKERSHYVIEQLTKTQQNDRKH